MNTTAKPFTGWHMLAIICTFFGVVIAVNVTMAVSSMRTWTGLVVANSYVESQRFNEKQHRIAAQREAGWSVQTQYRDGQIVFAARQADGAALTLEAVSAFVRRPVGGHDDATIALVREGGAYIGAHELAAGVWDVIITTAPTALGAIEYESRIVVE
ncbi:FixH family protein [Devosia sp. XK-2]|uniref:FixH family protein n=1 Tax=Devosia sp. XK-2 TaxID=3126689 RepID=UPI0030D3E28B